MQIVFKKFRTFTFNAADGETGSVHDIYFDDRGGQIRYVVLDLGKWYPGRRVLIKPARLKEVDVERRAIHSDLTRTAIVESPGIESDKPVSSQKVKALVDNDSISVTLSTDNEYLPNWFVKLLKTVGPTETEPLAAGNDPDPHLRSFREVIGYTVHTGGKKLGQIADIAFDSQRWQVRSLLLDNHPWNPLSKKTTIEMKQVKRLNWDTHTIELGEPPGTFAKDNVRKSL